MDELLAEAGKALNIKQAEIDRLEARHNALASAGFISANPKDRRIVLAFETDEQYYAAEKALGVDDQTWSADSADEGRS